MVELCSLSEEELKDWGAYINNLNRASHALRTIAIATLPLLIYI